MGEVLGSAEGLRTGGQQGTPLWPGPTEGKGHRIGDERSCHGSQCPRVGSGSPSRPWPQVRSRGHMGGPGTVVGP